jgi:acetyltransferase-like isoleucine patch superfamily enzyme
LTLTGHTGAVIRWESAVSPFNTWSPIANTATTYTSGALTQETKFRAVVQNGTCSEATSSEATLSFTTTTWNGTSWVGGAPSANKTLVIAANYTSPGSTFDLQGCSLTVQNNAVVTIVPQDTVILSGALTVATGSTVTFEAQAHLIQSGTTNSNSGNVIVKANSAPIKRLDYTLWSAPVAGQQMQAFSPTTLANRFYSYDSNTNFYTVVASPSTTSFETAKGVLVRVANNHSSTQPQAWTGTFTGVPNNGTYTIPLANFGTGKRFTLVGNPYPSPIDPEAFITNANNAASITGTIYLWRKTNGSNKPSYCTLNLGGFLSNGEEHSDGVAELPYQVIQTGQGFFVEGTGAGSGNVVFDNTMRVDDHTNSFLRTANTAHSANTVERNRIWLNITNQAGAFSQAMIGYMTNATNGVDLNYDGKYINDGEIALASVLDAGPYAIQCKALPFVATDVIPMQFTVTTAGNYSIAIDKVDGLFATGQNVYLRDNVTGTVHNLSEGAYTFAAEAGTFNARFEVVFQSSTLGVTDPVLNENQVVIYKTPTNEISINTGNFVMDNVMIYDLAGRLLFQQKDINDSQTVIKVGFATEVLLVKIKTQDGKSVSKKVLFPRTTLKKDIKISTIQVAEDE